MLLFFVGCQEVSQYKRVDTKVTIAPHKTSIKADEAKWRVGPLRKQRVSKGIRVKLSFPQLDKKDLKDLISHLGIDSWIVRVKRRTMITNQTLDYFYIPFLVPGRGTSDLRIKQIPAGFLNIYYSAAAISSRFEKFQCPAFDHRKEITGYEVISVNGQDKVIKGSTRNSISFNRKLEPYDYTPFSVNAGKEMNGEYRFEIALFDLKNKLRKSNWFLLPEAVKVTKEKLVALKGCKNFEIPDPDSKIDDIQDFKFGR